MKKINLYILLLLSIAASIIVYFSVPVIRERYFEKKNEEQVEIIKDIKTNGTANGIQEEDNLDDTEEDDSALTEEDLNVTPLEISTEDCDNNCEDFDEEEGDLDYCREVCNLNNTSNVSEDCSKLTGLNKDYCYKDKAITDKNLKLCDSVSDATIKKACKNRVAEDLIEPN
jgi:hypothetical protein